MAKAAIVVLAGTESHSDLGRLTNALQTAREFHETEDDDVELIFDGAGTQWIPELEEADHKYHELYTELKSEATAYEYCAGAFDVKDHIETSEVAVIGEHAGHPSLRSLVANGYEVITF